MSLALHSNVIMNQSQINPLQPIRAISSGDRVTGNPEKAAQIGVTTSLSTQASALSQKAENAGNSVSMLQVQSGGLSQIQEQMQQFRELTVQSGNGALNEKDQEALGAQKQAVLETINQIKESTQFNGKSLLKDGFNIDKNSFEGVGASTGSLNVNSTLEEIDESMQGISELQSQSGAVSNGLQSQINQFSDSAISHQSSVSRIKDADIAQEVSALSQSNLKEDIGIAIQSIKMNQNTALNLLMPR
ncbi:flagellin [Marinicellulosiphila megalodicopiae]|uniref:flagellin n=1 Tax=Marinicellulosiphila megalodicopiae TaxID=2724896 RepID=UPI003BB0C8B1